MRTLFLALLFPVSLFGQNFTLTVQGGFGDGIYPAGDTVHVWSDYLYDSPVFGAWGIGTSIEFADNKSWHTTLIMPAYDATVTAAVKAAGAFYLDQDIVPGRDTIKKVLSHFPDCHEGIVYLFHGAGEVPQDLANSAEYSQLIKDLAASKFAVILIEAEEVTRNQDLNGDGTLAWQSIPMDTINNVDYANIRILTDTFLQRGVMDGTKPRFAVGMSDGGAFSVGATTAFTWKAGVSYCSPASPAVIAETKSPILFCMAANDDHANVGLAGNAAAYENHQTLWANGICSRYALQAPQPLYPERFTRRPGIVREKSIGFFNELKSNGFLDANNYLADAGEVIIQFIQNNLPNFPTVLSMNAPQRNFLFEQIKVTAAEHQFSSDHNRNTIRFLENLCDGLQSGSSAIAVNPNSVSLFPNPFSTDIFVETDHKILEINLLNATGQRIATRTHSNQISTRNAAPGIYFLEIQTDAGMVRKKVLKL